MPHPLADIPPVVRRCSKCRKAYAWGPDYIKRIVGGQVIDLCPDCGQTIDNARRQLSAQELNDWMDDFIRQHFRHPRPPRGGEEDNGSDS